MLLKRCLIHKNDVFRRTKYGSCGKCKYSEGIGCLMEYSFPCYQRIYGHFYNYCEISYYYICFGD